MGPSRKQPDLAVNIDAAVADLAARVGVPRTAVNVVSAQPPGDGSRVVLSIEGMDRIFVYHANAIGEPELVPSGEPDGGHGFVPPPGIKT